MSAEPARPPFYARLLRLRNIHPGVVSCFLFLEGTLVLSGLLALAGLLSPWVVLVLPLAVAVAVKMNDLLAGATSGAVPAGRPARRRARTEPSLSQLARPARARADRLHSARTSRTSRTSAGSRAARSGTPTSRHLLSQKRAADQDSQD